MKVRVPTQVFDEADRYVVRKYFERLGDRSVRARASRDECGRFILGALHLALREQRDAMSRRQRAVAERLESGGDGIEPEGTPPELQPPAERQLNLLTMTGDE